MNKISIYPAKYIFHDICKYYGINEVFIKDCYSQRHRRYHDFNHVLRLIDKLNEMPDRIAVGNYTTHEVIRLFHLMVIAAIYHDIVYDPTDTNGQN